MVTQYQGAPLPSVPHNPTRKPSGRTTLHVELCVS